MARSQRENDQNNYDGTEVPGYYQRVSLDDIINNFMVAYVGEGKVISNVQRYDVAFWAQRALQEFSYDTLHSENSMELELSPAKTVLLPPDYVNMIRITKTDDNGNTIDIKRKPLTYPNSAVAQDSNYDPIFDSNGDMIEGTPSETIQKARDNNYDDNRRAIDYYNGFYYNDDFSYYNQKRFGLQPNLANQSNTYILDNNVGIIYFGPNLKQDDIITMYYISDGLADGDDLTKCYVPKLAEDAMYASILYNLAKLRVDAGQAAALYKKEAMAKLRNTKIRLMNLKPQEMIEVMRMKSKWIKH